MNEGAATYDDLDEDAHHYQDTAERKSDETKQINLEDETVNIDSEDTEEINLEGTVAQSTGVQGVDAQGTASQSTDRQFLITPRTLNFE